jgi:hypothetical protein
MTVRELRELLAGFPDDMPVWHDGGGDPYCASEVTSAEVRQSSGRRLLGHEHDTPDIWLVLG